MPNTEYLFNKYLYKKRRKRIRGQRRVKYERRNGKEK